MGGSSVIWHRRRRENKRGGRKKYLLGGTERPVIKKTTFRKEEKIGSLCLTSLFRTSPISFESNGGRIKKPSAEPKNPHLTTGDR